MGKVNRLVAAAWIFVVAVAGGASVARAEIVEGVVSRIVDGDTIWLETDDYDEETDERLKVRLVGIDAPETHLATSEGTFSQGKWGDAATAKLAEMAPVGTRIQVDVVGTDKYGRALGRLFRNGRDLNLELARLGLAIPYIICEGDTCTNEFFAKEHVAAYLDACKHARSHGLGIFSPTEPLGEMPFEFRLRHQNRRPDKHVGDFGTKRLYAPAQYRKVDACARIFFFSASAAKRVGYRPH